MAQVIFDPIDLSTIREKNQKYEYKTAVSFLADFDLMRRNAIKFNGELSPFSIEAKEIYEFVKSTIDENRDEFSAMEEAVVDQLAGKKKSNKKKGGDSSATSSNTGTMANNMNCNPKSKRTTTSLDMNSPPTAMFDSKSRDSSSSDGSDADDDDHRHDVVDLLVDGDDAACEEEGNQHDNVPVVSESLEQFLERDRCIVYNC